MARHSRAKKEEARRLFLTNEVTSVAEIARRVRVKPHTVARWKKEENWDGLRLQVERRAAEKMVEEIATEWVALNAQHLRGSPIRAACRGSCVGRHGFSSRMPPRLPPRALEPIFFFQPIPIVETESGYVTLGAPPACKASG